MSEHLNLLNRLHQKTKNIKNLIVKKSNFTDERSSSHTIGSFYCNRDRKIAYLAIKKCGCTSIARYIAKQKVENILTPIWKPENAKHNFDFVTTDEKSLSEYFTFTFVRNPYDRFLSFYKNWIVNPPQENILEHYKKFGFFKNMPFDECVKAFSRISDVSLLEAHTIPLYFSVFRDKTLRVKFVGKLENIDNDFTYIKNACSLEGELQKLNSSKAKTGSKKTSLYTPELKELIYSFYRLDFEVFGYSK